MKHSRSLHPTSSAVSEDEVDLTFPVVYGRSEMAIYRETPIPSYQGNPLIEALPPILLQEEAIQQLAYYPEFDERHRALPAELRFHLIQAALDLFEPFPIHLDLEQRLSRIIRGGYKARNPLRREDWQELDRRVCAFSGQPGFPPPPSTAAGFTLLGISGVGKTTTVERILLLYPQVIFHSRYGERTLSLTQLVWLKLDCPHDGSTKGLCLAFFQAIDHRLGTHYYQYYAKDGQYITVDAMLPKMARVAALHRLGVLVVDELQHLSEAKSGGIKKMLNLFVQLVNTIGTPVVLIGTHKARRLLTGEFRQARRSTGQGDPIWNNMLEDEVWQLFLEALWRYQYVRQPAPLTPELSHILYDETQGITDFAVKIFMLAQIRAITTGLETITPDIIRSVAADSLRFAATALTALRKGDRHVLQQFEDLHLLELEPYLQQARLDLRVHHRTSLELTGQAETDHSALPPSSQEPHQPPPPASPSGHGSAGLDLDSDDIRQIVSQGLTEGMTAYQALHLSKYTRTASEYLSGVI